MYPSSNSKLRCKSRNQHLRQLKTVRMMTIVEKVLTDGEAYKSILS